MEESKSSLPNISHPPQAALQACLEALLDEDSNPRPFTYRTRQLLESLKPRMGEANALLIEGIRKYNDRDAAFASLSRAEEKGCNHPSLYYFLGHCYSGRCRGVEPNELKALGYYVKAVQGGCSLGHIGICSLYAEGCMGDEPDMIKGLNYLLDLEKAGQADGAALCRLALFYREYTFNGNGTVKDSSVALKYYQRALDLGCVEGAIGMHNMLWIRDEHGNVGDKNPIKEDKNKALLVLTDFIKRYSGVKIHRALATLIECLSNRKSDNPYGPDPFSGYTPSEEVLDGKKNLDELLLYYCDVAIKNEVPEGYLTKGRVYLDGLPTIPIDANKAKSIWEEADRVGLATFNLYDGHLVPLYNKDPLVNSDNQPQTNKYGHVDGKKVVEYYEKALELAEGEVNRNIAINGMVAVYKHGIPPFSIDGNKVIECYKKRLQVSSIDKSKEQYYFDLADLYSAGCPPIPQNGSKVLECYIDALFYTDNPNEIYSRMADVYDEGLVPVEEDQDKANELNWCSD